MENKPGDHAIFLAVQVGETEQDDFSEFCLCLHC